MPKNTELGPGAGTRADAIRRLEPGDTYAVCKRVALDFGVTADEMRNLVSKMRGSIDGQVHKMRNKHRDRTFKTEIISALVPDGSAIVVGVTVTRFE